MKRSTIFAIFAIASTVMSFTSATHAADPKDFPLKVHVSSSELKTYCTDRCGDVQYVEVQIDGKKYE